MRHRPFFDSCVDVDLMFMYMNELSPYVPFGRKWLGQSQGKRACHRNQSVVAYVRDKYARDKIKPSFHMRGTLEISYNTLIVNEFA